MKDLEIRQKFINELISGCKITKTVASKYEEQLFKLIGKPSPITNEVQYIYFNVLGEMYGQEKSADRKLVWDNIKKKQYGFQSNSFEDARQNQMRRRKNIVEPPTVEDGNEVCPNNKCKSKKNSYIQVQMRRADEPMTKFYSCTECSKRWKKG